MIAVFAFVLAACGETSDAPSEVVRTVEVERQVTVEVEKLVTVEVEKPVVQEVVRVVEVEKPVEVVRQVTVEVMQEAQTLPPLVIGHLNALTGSLSYFGVSHGNAAELAASHVNRAGGIQGGSVVIISRDTGVNPVQGVDAARALVDVESVSAIVGALASGVTIPVATSVTAPNKTLQISHSSTAPSITALDDDDFLFRTTVSDAAQGVVLGRLAWEQGYKSAGIMYINNAYGEGLAAQFTGVIPERLHGLTNSLQLLNPETQDFDPYDVSAVQDIDKIRPTISQTLEFGYKGIVRNKLVLAADFYRTQMNDYTLPLWIFTPSVFLDEGSLRSALSQGIADYLADPANAQLATLIRFLDTAAFGGNGNGDYTDEVDRYVDQIAEGTAMIPFGTVTPEQASDPTAVALTYRNFGDVTVYGADLGLSWFPNRSWHITGSYSYIHRNLFENVENLGDVPLNSPKHKFSGGVTYRPSRIPLTLGGKISYRGAFPMLDGVYAGPVDAYAVVDANAAYQFSAITFSVEASNLLNTKYRAFVGAPEIGRLLSAGVAVRF